MTKGDYLIRAATRPEVDFTISLALKEGWNPGLHDAESFYHNDPGGFLVGLLDDRPAGCISCVSYGQTFGFIGFYIVLPEYRGKGYGTRLWQSAMQRLYGQNIGLDAVPEQEITYARSGFHRAHRNIRFEYLITKAPVTDGEPEIREIHNIPFDSVISYDRQCFPAARLSFLQGWLNMPGSVSLGYVKQNQMKGYGAIRRCHHGYKIGPLFADDGAIAENLYVSLISGIAKGTAVYLDVPEPNQDALALACKYDMKGSFTTVRMYSRGEPDIALSKVFGITTFELG